MGSEFSIRLWADTETGTGFRPSLDIYPLETGVSAGAVLICPGGGYAIRAPHEGVDVARRYNDMGFHAFVLQYSVAPARHPAPLNDVSRAVRIIRHNAARWNVNPLKIAVCGFSAGGHLAASAGAHYGLARDMTGDDISRENNRPDALILCYPVISADVPHTGSFYNLLGRDAPPEAFELMSIEKHVGADTPPSFLWHASDDKIAPVENSLLFAGALSKLKIPFELHIYEKGGHGLGLARQNSDISGWFDLSSQWLRRMGW